MNAFMQSLSVQGSRRAEYFLAEELPAIKRIISAFIDADENELALVPNFSFGLNAIIPSLHHHRNVLLFDDDYPSLTQPFLLNKFNISWVRQMDGFSFDLQEIEEIIANKSIDIAAVSHVQYQTGYCIDIQAISAICKRYNVLLIVDGTQSLGAMPFSFHKSEVDIFISSNYKWMNAGYGSGIMAVKQKFLEKHEPRIGGFASFVKKTDSWKYEPSILSYEPGHLNYGGLLVLEDAIGLKLKLGLQEIYEHNLSLARHLLLELKRLDLPVLGTYDLANRSSIICLPTSDKLVESLENDNVVFTVRNSSIRFGIHFYNTKEDINRVVGAISKATA